MTSCWVQGPFFPFPFQEPMMKSIFPLAMALMLGSLFAIAVQTTSAQDCPNCRSTSVSTTIVTQNAVSAPQASVSLSGGSTGNVSVTPQSSGYSGGSSGSSMLQSGGSSGYSVPMASGGSSGYSSTYTATPYRSRFQSRSRLFPLGNRSYVRTVTIVR